MITISTTPPRLATRPLRRVRWVRVQTVLAVIGLAAMLAPTVPAVAQDPDPGGPAEITDGTLTWGFKESFRHYVGPDAITVHDGASVNDDGTFNFPVTSASYDEEGEATAAAYTGAVHFLKYPTSTGEHLLDITISNPRVEITRDRQVLFAHVTGREMRLSPPAPPVTDFGEVPVAVLDIAPASVDAADGITVWSGIASYITEDMAAVFGNQYPAQTAIDPLSFSYEGPGTKPDLGDPDWATPGAPLLEVTQSQVMPHTALYWFQDLERGIAYALDTENRIQAFDIDTLAPVGDVYTPANTGSMIGRKAAFDGSRGWVVTSSLGTRKDETAGGGTDGNVVASRWDPGTGQWVSEVVATPPELAALEVDPEREYRLGLTWMTYDPGRHRVVPAGGFRTHGT